MKYIELILFLQLMNVSLLAQADTVVDNQFFVQLIADSATVKCGVYRKTDTREITKVFFIQDDSSAFWSPEQALELVWARQHGKPLFFLHGFYGASLSLAQRTTLAFDLFFLKDKECQTSDIIHIVWASDKLNYRNSQQNIAKSRNQLANFFRLAYAKKNQPFDLLCHSMGNQMLLETIKAGLLTTKILDKLILAAPDLDMDDFLVYQEGIDFLAQDILILFHRRDKILAASRFRNMGKRLGQRHPPQLSKKFTILDCTKKKIGHSLGAKWNKHTYFLASDEVRKQMHLFLSGTLSIQK